MTVWRCRLFSYSPPYWRAENHRPGWKARLELALKALLLRIWGEPLERPERPVVVLDDVCTTGGSTLDAVNAARAAGMEVLGAICLVDREEGAAGLLATVDCSLARVFTLEELVRSTPSSSRL